MAEQTKNKAVFHFISHTHWDREWYLPFDPSFEYFHLDGQTIVLEDYYAIVS